MKILFIGGTGNISADCAAWLHARRYEILVVSRGRNAVPPPYGAVQADRKDPQAMRAALQGERPEVVINFLGYEVADVQLLHITSDEVLTWNQIYAEIATALGVASPQIVKVPTDFICRVAPRMTGTLQGDKAHPGVFDNSKIKRFVPGFQCRKPFHVGVRESVAWLRAHPEDRQLNPQVDALCDEVIPAWLRANR